MSVPRIAALLAATANSASRARVRLFFEPPIGVRLRGVDLPRPALVGEAVRGPIAANRRQPLL
jgi:hypothetical protein